MHHSHKFFSSMSAVMIGTGISQLLMFGMLPIASHFYDPSQYAVLVAFLALPNAILPAASGRFEVAMVLPRNPRTARRLLGFAIQSCIVTSLMLLAWTMSTAESPGSTKALEPLFLLLAGLVTVFQYLLNRQGRFALLGCSKVIVSATIVGVILIMGFAGVGPVGLVIAYLAGQAAGLTTLAICNRDQVRDFVPMTSRVGCATLSRYRDFPLFNAPGSLIDGVTIVLPVLFFEHYCSKADLGALGMMMSVVFAPATLVAMSIGQVNLRTVSKIVGDGGRAVGHVLRISTALWGLGILGALLATFWGPEIFAMVLGEDYRESGRFAAVFAPAIGVRFAVSPLSSTLAATQRNRLGMAWRCLAFVATLAILLFVGPTGSAIDILAALAKVDVVLYLIYFAFILYAAARPNGPRARTTTPAGR